MTEIERTNTQIVDTFDRVGTAIAVAMENINTANDELQRTLRPVFERCAAAAASAAVLVRASRGLPNTLG